MADPVRTASRLRVLIHSGLFIQRDAISGSVRAKVECIDRWAAAGRDISWRVQCLASDSHDARVRVVTSISQSYLERSFLEADIHIFEFGIYYELFDALFVVPEHAVALAVYHNVTPLELVSDPFTRDRVAMSMVQLSNMSVCHEIACDSPFNRDELIGLGFPPDQLSVLPLPPAVDLRSRRNERIAHKIAHVLFVGRFVTAKGIVDLIDAARALRAEAVPFVLTLAGSLDFADDEAQRAIGEAQSEGLLATDLDSSKSRLAELYLDADVFVMPSYHEGYCLPIVEALSAGCQIVASTAGNLPNIVGDLGQLVPPGNAEALRAALAPVLARLATGDATHVRDRDGWADRDAWLHRVDAHVACHSAEAFEEGFAALVDRAEARLGQTVPS
jgi:glycosyltransferase involved in cell wall biosynthesis